MALAINASDLFGAPVVPGLSIANEFISEADEARLVGLIDAEPLAPFRFQGWLGKRLTRSFGWSYDFDTGRLGEVEPIPAWLQPLKARVAAFAGLDSDEIVQSLLTRYDPGAGIGWHRDRPVFEHVVGISLGSPATLRLRRRRGTRFERAAVPLDRRGVYHLSGEVRHEWEHSIVETMAPRWSITFRSLSGQ